MAVIGWCLATAGDHPGLERSGSTKPASRSSATAAAVDMRDEEDRRGDEPGDEEVHVRHGAGGDGAAEDVTEDEEEQGGSHERFGPAVDREQDAAGGAVDDR